MGACASAPVEGLVQASNSASAPANGVVSLSEERNDISGSRKGGSAQDIRAARAAAHDGLISRVSHLIHTPCACRIAPPRASRVRVGVHAPIPCCNAIENRLVRAAPRRDRCTLCSKRLLC
jgi:hypothetical protein